MTDAATAAGSRSRLLLGLLCLAVGAWALWSAFFGTTGEASPARLAPFRVFPVVEPELARLEQELRSEAVSGPLEPEALSEETRHLIAFLANAPPELASSAAADVRELGQACVPILASVALSSTAEARERAAAIQLLGALDGVHATTQLLLLVENRESFVRAHAAWRLAEGSEDWIVPALAERLAIETNDETRLRLAAALARRGNLSWLGALQHLARTARDEDLRALAIDELGGILRLYDAPALERRGTSAADALIRAWARWDGGPSELFARPAPSPRYRLEVWRRIEALGGSDPDRALAAERARDALPTLGPAAALLLARTLHDEHAGRRAAAASCLARMGPRASVAGPELTAALADPGLAPTAALAVGLVGHPAGEGALLAVTAPREALELRVGAARGLGHLGLASSVPALEGLLDADEPRELRQAAAASLVLCGAGERAAALLCDLLEAGGEPSPHVAEPGFVSSESALERFLARRSLEGAPAAAEILERWSALAPRERATLVRSRLDALAP